MPKSSGFKIIPVNMSEVFLFMCNLKFSSASSFSRVRDILAVALASLYPLKEEELYQVNDYDLSDRHDIQHTVQIYTSVSIHLYYYISYKLIHISTGCFCWIYNQPTTQGRIQTTHGIIVTILNTSHRWEQIIHSSLLQGMA